MKRVKQLLILSCLCLYAGVSQAQVTIGSETSPNTFSVLELISNKERGLRLPQLTTGERDNLSLSAITDEAIKANAKGLMIYNTDTDCVETWNGEEWIASCGCKPTENIIIKANTDWQQHKSSAAFAFRVDVDGTTDGLIVDWYVNGGTEPIGSTIGDRIFYYNPREFGPYIVQAKVRESCLETSDIVSNLDTVYVGCGAYTSVGNWLVFMCHNLGADTSLDPFTPDAGLHGAKYRFGAKQPSLTMVEDQNPDNNEGVEGWTYSSTADFPFQADGDWSTENNPCPSGWRLPTHAEWEGVINTSLNTQTAVGTDWGGQADNFSTGRKFGEALFLPAAGQRNYDTGALAFRGYYGRYWSSTQNGTYGHFIYFGSGGTYTGYDLRWFGSSVRCVAD